MLGLSVPVKLSPVLIAVVASIVGVVVLIHDLPTGLQVIGLIVTCILGHRAAVQLRTANDQYVSEHHEREFGKLGDSAEQHVG